MKIKATLIGISAVLVLASFSSTAAADPKKPSPTAAPTDAPQPKVEPTAPSTEPVVVNPAYTG